MDYVVTCDRSNNSQADLDARRMNATVTFFRPASIVITLDAEKSKEVREWIEAQRPAHEGFFPSSDTMDLKGDEDGLV